MISLRDTLLLAQTKLKTRRIRLFITVFVSALLFACLVFISVVTTGIIDSINSFSKEGYGGRYLVQASPLTYSPNPENEQPVIDELRAYQKELIAQKTASAKKLGIQYDPSTDTTLPITEEALPDGSKQSFLNYNSAKVQEKYNAKNNSIPNTSYEDFQKIAKEAGASATFRATIPLFSFANTSGNTQVIINGKEKLSGPQAQNQYKPTGIESIQTLGWRSMDAELLKPFVIPGQSLESDGKTVAVIAPFSAAEEVIGLKPLAETATSEEKLARLNKVRAEIVGKKFQLCYRNMRSAELAATAQQIQTDIEKNKSNKNFVAPNLIYNLPKTPCGAITIKSDKRSAPEKAEQEKIDTFNKQFGMYEEPVQGLIDMRIVGLSPDINDGAAINASTILSTLFSSSTGNGWVSPSEDILNNPLASKAQGGNINTIDRNAISYIAEFNNLDAMKQFIDSQECNAIDIISIPGSGNIVSGQNGSDPITQCIEQNKTLAVSTFGNSAGAIDDFKNTIWNFGKIVIVIIVVLSSLVMMANIGKIIADGRRETAVFRALGARRIDITQIYLTYAVLLAMIIFGVALLIGFIGATYIERQYGSDFSTAAVLVYNAQDTSKAFRFYGISVPQITGIVILSIATGLISALLPLLMNMRRNPINDMRDER